MTILKTSLHKSLLVLALTSTPAFAFSTMNCLKDMIPLTDHGVFQRERKRVENPFFVNDKYLVFPEVEGGRLHGFYVYADDHAWYFDAVKDDAKTLKISDLTFKPEEGILELVGQPEGLETISLSYVPGYNPYESDSKGPVILGAAVLPVVGGLVTPKQPVQTVYYDPKRATEDELKAWVAKHTSGRKPAKVNSTVVNEKIVKLVSIEKPSQEQLWAPLKQELKLRKAWVKNNNLDEETFRRFGHVMETTCKQ